MHAFLHVLAAWWRSIFSAPSVCVEQRVFRRWAFEQRETRNMLSATVLWDDAGGILSITGSNMNDEILVTSGNASGIGDKFVWVKDQVGNMLWDGGGPTAQAGGPPVGIDAKANEVNRIYIHGLDGVDTIGLVDVGTDGFQFQGLDQKITVYGGKDHDSINGSQFADYLDGGAEGANGVDSGQDYISGKNGNDFILGGDLNDTLSGDDGADTIDGGDEEDFIHGDGLEDTPGSGADTILGGLGADEIFGGPGNDVILGGDDDAVDKIEGGSGNDTIHGGDGNDRLFGYLRYFPVLDEEEDLVEDLVGPDQAPVNTTDSDLIVGGAGADLIVGGPGVDQLYGGGGIDTINGGAGDDVMYSQSNGEQVIMRGQKGNDTMWGGAGTDQMYGGEDDDTIYAAGFVNSVQSLIGGSGNDKLYGPQTGMGTFIFYGGIDDDQIWGSDTDDEISGQAGNDKIYGGVGEDSIYAGAGNDYVDGGSGNDTIFGDHDGEDQLAFGPGGDDLLIGGVGDDMLQGDGGDDFLWQDAKNDAHAPFDATKLIGGAGHNWLNAFSDLQAPEHDHPHVDTLTYNAATHVLTATGVGDIEPQADGTIAEAPVLRVVFYKDLINNPGPAGQTAMNAAFNYLRDAVFASDYADPWSAEIELLAGSHVLWATAYDMDDVPGKPASVHVTVPLAAVEGAPAEIALPGSDTIDEWVVDWGDGTSPEAYSGTATSASHIYADGGWSGTITLYADGAAYDSFGVYVDNVAPTLAAASGLQVYIGQTFTIVDIGVFTDPGFGPTEVFTDSIFWGDGNGESSPITIDQPGSPGVLTQGSFDGTHSYAAAGTYNVLVTVSDDDGGFDTDQLTITVIKPTVTVAASDASAAEVGTDKGVLTFTRTGPTTSALTVVFSASGTASSNADYVPLPLQVVIPAGQASVTLDVNPLVDYLVEGPETVVATVNSTPLFDAGSSATVTIADTPAPVVSVTASDAQAGESGNNIGQYTIARTGSTAFAMQVSVSMSGTATLSTDYGLTVNGQAAGGIITIPVGQSSVVVTLTAVADLQGEGIETAVMTVGANPAQYVIAAAPNSAATVSILDAGVWFSIADAQGTEGQNGNVNQFTITRSGDLSGTAMVMWSAQSGTATGNADYQTSGGMVTFLANETSKIITVTIVNDLLDENDEWFSVTLTSQMGAQFLDNLAIGTIHDND